MLWLKVQVTVTKAVWVKTDPGHSVSCTLGKKVMTVVKSLSAKIFLSHADYHLWDICPSPLPSSLLWRHSGRDGVSNHQLHDCLLNCLFRLRSKKTSKLRVTGLCAGEFPAQMASNAENVFIWWRHHALRKCQQKPMKHLGYDFVRLAICLRKCKFGAHFKDDFSIVIQIRWKTDFCVSPMYGIISLQNCVHVATA